MASAACPPLSHTPSVPPLCTPPRISVLINSPVCFPPPLPPPSCQGSALPLHEGDALEPDLLQDVKLLPDIETLADRPKPCLQVGAPQGVEGGGGKEGQQANSSMFALMQWTWHPGHTAAELGTAACLCCIRPLSPLLPSPHPSPSSARPAGGP